MLKLADPPFGTQEQPTAEVPVEPVEQKPPRPTWQEFTALAKAADEGSAEAQTRLRKLLDAHPYIWRSVGSLDSHVETALIGTISTSCLTSESIKRVMAAMTEELAGKEPSALTKLAAEQVVVCWAFLRHTELNALEATESLRDRRIHDQAVDQAHRRYMESIKVLGALTGKIAAKIGATMTGSQMTPAEPGEPGVHERNDRAKPATDLTEEPTEQDQRNGHSFDQESTAVKAA